MKALKEFLKEKKEKKRKPKIIDNEKLHLPSPISNIDQLNHIEKSSSNNGCSSHKQKYCDAQGELLHEKYRIGKEIGRGTDGVVKLCKLRKSWLKKQLNTTNNITDHFVSNISKQRTRAVKIIDKAKIDVQHLKDIYNEINVLSQVSFKPHDNILRCYETFETQNKIYIITELLSGDTLESRIVREFNNGLNGFPEVTVAVILYQLLEALNYLHKLNVVHRDIKPENIIFSNETTNTLKIIDFGLAGVLNIQNDFKLSQACGTPFYVAPEVIDERNIKKIQYNEKVDMWSIGIVLYAMLCGHLPFSLQSNQHMSVLYTQILKCDIDMTSPKFNQISSQAKDLLLSLLERDPLRRLSAKDALEHEWFRIVFAKFVYDKKKG